MYVHLRSLTDRPSTEDFTGSSPWQVTMKHHAVPPGSKDQDDNNQQLGGGGGLAERSYTERCQRSYPLSECCKQAQDM